MSKKMTKQQHAEYGDALKSAADATCHIQALLSNCYGKTCRERLLAEKANTALLHLRSALDSIACVEHPADPHATRLYFGQRIAKIAQSA